MITSAKNLYHHLLQQLTERDEEEKKAFVRLLLQNRLGLSSTDIVLDKAVESIDFSGDIQRLNLGEPIQYILGTLEFADITFLCGPGALIPRPETEELFYALRKLGPFSRILDIGTGTGCLAHSLSRAFPDAYVEAWDISEDALAWAEKNKQFVQSSVTLRKQNALDIALQENAMWDLIVSNPPYVLPSEKAFMHPRVVDHEPALALFVPEEDPLLFYREITRYAQHKLQPGGILGFEINQKYGREVLALLESAGFAEVQLRQDIPGKDRMVLGRR